MEANNQSASTYRIHDRRVVSPFGFLITPLNGKLYDNKIDINGIAFVLSSNIENAKVTNRIAIIEAVPSRYHGKISVGDVVCVHHNVFRKYHDHHGNERFSTDMFSGDTYVVTEDSFFMFKGKDSEWETLRDIVFVLPSNIDNYGSIAFTNEHMRSIGLAEGVEIGFSPESEYEFRIDGIKYYKMSKSDICLMK